MLLNVFDVLILLLIFQLVFSGIFLFSKKSGKAAEHKLLGIFFFAICISLADTLLLKTGISNNYPNLATLGTTFPFLYGPLLFLYTKSVIYKSFSFKKQLLVHYIPFAVLFIALTLTYELQSREQKIKILASINTHHVSPSLYIIAFLMIVHFSVYAIYALTLIRKFNRTAPNKYSTVKQTNLNWLSSMIIFFLVLFVFSLVGNVLELSSIKGLNSFTSIIIVLLLFFFINRFLLKTLQNPEYFLGIEPEDDVYLEQKKQVINLPDRSAELQQLNNYMRQQKSYLNPSLTVEELAKGLKMHPKEVSKLINEHLQQNFFDFINRYRIEDAKHLLLHSDDDKITVLEILYKVGFNSKSSFNTLFKKYTGLTPTSFKNHKN